MQEMLLVIWGGGVVVGSPQGARQYQPCMPMWLTKFVTWYLVPYGTIVDPSQVSPCLITVYDPTPPGLDLYLWFPFDWYAMICLLCHVIFIYILLDIFYTHDMFMIIFATACLLHDCWFIHGIWLLSCEYIQSTHSFWAGFSCQIFSKDHLLP